MTTDTIRFIDLFGGIGGFRHGLEQSSDKFECVDYIEYDKYAVKSYNEIFGEQHEPRDVTELSTEQIREHDLLCAGFPCQSFSIAGNRQGTDEARGKLFRQIVRIAEAHRPEMLLLENVKGILSQKAVKDGEAVEGTKGHAFRQVLASLHELGYCLEWQVLNSKNWGVPQNRERVFIIGHLGGEPRQKVFPIRREDQEDTRKDGRELEQIATGEDIAYTVDASYYKGTSPGDIGKGRRTQIIQNHRNMEIREHGNESPTLNKKQGGGQLPMVLNHQFRPETCPSIEEGQSGGSGLLYNSEYSYALSSSPHYAVEPAKNTDLTEKVLQFIPLKSDENTVYSPDGRRLSKHYDYDTEEWHWEYEHYNPDFAEIPDKVQPCITPDRVNKRQNGRRMKENNDPMFTLTGQDIHGVTENKKRIRKLTPKECWRLQGFPDKSFHKAEQVNSDTQLYKQAGNAVTVNVIKALGEEIEDYL